jgi:hypothetical protein
VVKPTPETPVIPGRCEAPNPESSETGQKMDSGFRPAAGPGMTPSVGRARLALS